jgi:hypothetical protein
MIKAINLLYISCKFSYNDGKYDMVKFLGAFLRYVVATLFVLVIIIPSLTASQTTGRLPKYVGSDACKECHESEYRNFVTYAKKSTSFKSIDRVRKGLTDDQIKECYFCHTTGYGKAGGFVSPEKTPHLKNAGCEVCHGPGEFHIKTKNPKEMKRHLTIKDCEACHTPERVRAFRYKPLIHGGAH